MNTKILSAVLVAVCLGLAAGWYWTNQRAEEQASQLVRSVAGLSNELNSAVGKLSEQRQVNATLNTQLSQRNDEVAQLSNRWTASTAALEKAGADAKAAEEASKGEMAKRDARIAELETEKDDLTKKMDSLNLAITGLNGQIQETQRKLSASEGDRAELRKELKRLLAEKAELERKFNDLAVLRAQVRKLREEMSISRRLDFLRRGLYASAPENKGATVLQRGVPPPGPPATNGGFHLDVSVGTDGASSVTLKTNAPAAR